MFTEDKVTKIFCMADDFCRFFDEMMVYEAFWKRFILVNRLILSRLSQNMKLFAFLHIKIWRWFIEIRDVSWLLTIALHVFKGMTANQTQFYGQFSPVGPIHLYICVDWTDRQKSYRGVLIIQEVLRKTFSSEEWITRTVHIPFIKRYSFTGRMA